MKSNSFRPLILSILLLTSTLIMAQDFKKDSLPELNMYLIERDIPDAGLLTVDQLQGISATSCEVLSQMNKTEIKWIESYITDNKVICRYMAKNEDLLHIHAQKGGFPITKITMVKNKIDPSTAEIKN